MAAIPPLIFLPFSSSAKSGQKNLHPLDLSFRACLKIAFRRLHALICQDFIPFCKQLFRRLSRRNLFVADLLLQFIQQV